MTGIRADVSNSEDLDRLFAQIKSEKGRLDVVVANAVTAKYAPLGKISEELYRSIFDVNVKGVLFTVQKALPLIPEGGSIILNVDCRQQRPPCKQCLQRYEGGGALVCADVDDRFERPADSCKCREPWFHRYRGPKGTVRFFRSRTATVKGDSRIGATWTARKTPADSPGCGVSRVRRQQLQNGDGIVRRWRFGSSVSESDLCRIRCTE